MATPILSHSISQFQLAHYATLANQIEALKAEQSALEHQLTASLDSGAVVEPGNHTAKLRTTERRNVSWKKVVIRLKSEGYANKVLSATKPTTYTRLVVR